MRPAGHLDKPQLTAEWENNLTQIAKGKTDPAAFMEGIEDMARELVKTYPFLSEADKGRFKEEKPELGKCPRCGSPVYEGKKNYYCSNRECSFTMCCRCCGCRILRSQNISCLVCCKHRASRCVRD